MKRFNILLTVFLIIIAPFISGTVNTLRTQCVYSNGASVGAWSQASSSNVILSTVNRASSCAVEGAVRCQGRSYCRGTTSSTNSYQWKPWGTSVVSGWTTIYSVNWDGNSADCACKTGSTANFRTDWGAGQRRCCGDDGAADKMSAPSGTTCRYCNSGTKGIDNSYQAICKGRADYPSGIAGGRCYTSDRVNTCTYYGWTCSNGNYDDTKPASCYGRSDYTNGISGATCYRTNKVESCTTGGWTCINGLADNSKALCNGREDFASGINGNTCWRTNQLDSCTTSGWICNPGTYDPTKAACPGREDYTNGIDGNRCYTTNQNDQCGVSGWTCTAGASTTAKAACKGREDFTDGIEGGTCWMTDQVDLCTTSGWQCTDSPNFDTTKATGCIGADDFTDGINVDKCYLDDQTDVCDPTNGWECTEGNFVLCDSSTECAAPCNGYTCIDTGAGNYAWVSSMSGETDCTDNADNDCDGLVDCEDPDCPCGTPGPGNTICNGNKFDNIAYSVISVTKYNGNCDYCTSSYTCDATYNGCLDTATSGHSMSDVKCGNSGTGEFGICYDDGSTNECKKLDSTNLQKLAESGYSCPSDQEYKFGDTIELDLQFDHAGDTEVNNWNYLVECNYDTSNEDVAGWSQGSNLVNIDFTLSNPVYDAQAFNPINLGIECKVWTDYYNKNGWEVDTMSFNVIVTPSCSDECVIGGVVYKHGDNNSANTCEICDVTNHQFNWTEKPDGGTCFGNPAGPSDRGLCCANKCTTPTTGGFYTDDSVTDSTDGAGLGLDQSCIVGRRVGQLKCFGDELRCDGLECSDSDNTDGMWNKDADAYFENAAGQCDNHSDCSSNLQGCSQNSCRCENLATCTIPGDSNVYFDGDINPANFCQMCNTSRNVYNWSYMSVGEPCGPWQCSSSLGTYTEDGGPFAVKGMCRDTGTDIRCEDVYEAFCADSDLTDYGKGTQVKACSAECDSPNDENLATGEACDCSTIVDGKCINPCTWGQMCDGVRILNTAFYCGKQDYVCPEDFYDPTAGEGPMCTGIGILPECADPDC